MNTVRLLSILPSLQRPHFFGGKNPLTAKGSNTWAVLINDRLYIFECTVIAVIQYCLLAGHFNVSPF